MFSEGHFLTWILGQNFHLSDDWWALVCEWKFCAPHRTFTLSSSFEEGGTQGKSAMSWMVRLALVVTLLREMMLCCPFFCGSWENFENFCMRGRFLLFSTPPKDFLNRKSFSTGLLRILLKNEFSPKNFEGSTRSFVQGLRFRSDLMMGFGLAIYGWSKMSRRVVD